MQFYCPDTNILATRFFTPHEVGHVMDYMPVATQANGPEQARQLIRRVKVTRGTITFRIECSPAFDYARQEHETKITAEGACFYKLRRVAWPENRSTLISTTIDMCHGRS